MELSEAVRRRRMVRAYDPGRPVPEAALQAVVQAALRAPSAGFTQGVSWLVLTEAADRDAFWQITADERSSRWLHGMRTAPALLTVWTSQAAYLDRYAEADKAWTGRDVERWSAPYWFVDAGMASMAALLSAVDANLGACFFGVPPPRIAAVREQFGVPTDQLSVGVISLGYAASTASSSGSASRRRRKPEEELVHRHRW